MTDTRNPPSGLQIWYGSVLALPFVNWRKLGTGPCTAEQQADQKLLMESQLILPGGTATPELAYAQEEGLVQLCLLCYGITMVLLYLHCCINHTVSAEYT